MLPAAGEVAPEAVEEDDDEEDSEVIEGSERELLEATFGEHLLPHEVDLATAGGEAEDASAASGEDAGEGASGDAEPDEAETEVFGGVDEVEGDEVEGIAADDDGDRAEEHTSDLQSLISHSYEVLCS